MAELSFMGTEILKFKDDRLGKIYILNETRQQKEPTIVRQVPKMLVAMLLRVCLALILGGGNSD